VLISPEKELWGYKECAASIDRGSVPSTLLIFMSDLIPAKKKAGPQNVARRFVEKLDGLQRRYRFSQCSNHRPRTEMRSDAQSH
jgi:hypothetical protein